MRIARHTTRLVASAAVLAAALSLTACENDTKKTDSQAPAVSSHPESGGQGTPSSSGAKGPAKDGDSSKAASGAAGSGAGGKNGSGQAAGKGSGGQKATVACTGAQVKVTATKVNRPINHMLLTATNTGSGPCHAYNAPYLRWDDAQAATAFLDKSKPQAVITLAPGESAYAGVMYQSADGSGSGGYTARTLGVLFANRAGNGSTGPAVRLPLPKGGIATDSSAWVTYWQSTAEEALTW
ncbi:Protein of unknown function [Streptomyces sp. 2323.1]|uniref:DUF4232 domain-containing protein n=1 Tax=Streptomyces sp. 2323.1 TaxID=1938841 RepID=UPI000BB754F9|nr:DUF4232 domain-containing protein [Streptomyces sp. 2323.1]SOE15828.1 Protein of unknown function [Streptomyces sp. 2323.1]